MNTHGGARPGAGRKRSPRKPVLVSWRISEASREWIKETASAACITPGEVVDELIAIAEAHLLQNRK
jgi:hypothetical protein